MSMAEERPRLRVALNASFWGQETVGSGQYLHHLVEALVRLDEAPEVLLCGAPEWRGGRPLPSGVAWHDVPVSLWRRLGPNLEKVWFEQVAYPQAARRTAAMVAHVPYFASPLAPTRPTVVTVHDLIPLLLPAYRGSAAVRGYGRLVALAARRADLVLTDAEAARKDIIRHLGIPSARVRAIPLATGSAYRPVEDAETLKDVRARYALPAQYLLYLGGFDQRRNLGTLFRALALARQRDPDLPPLALAGVLPASDSVLTPDPRRLAAEAGVAEGVRFLGRVAEEDKPALYSAARAFVFPSRYEGFGLTVLEALACGTPVIAADATSLPEVGGPGALLVGPDDVDGWAAALVRLANDDALRAGLRAAGLAHAARFSWQRTARETLAAYRQVLGEAQRSDALRGEV